MRTTYTCNRNEFGGIIYESDFDHGCSMKYIAERILNDWKFDIQCAKNIELKEKFNKGRNR